MLNKTSGGKCCDKWQVKSSWGLTQWKIKMGCFAPRPRFSRYSPSLHVMCGLLCMFQEAACGCHVRNSKSESEHVEIKKTTGIAQQR